MPRIARVVIPDVPHHVVQRGNRRQTVFFKDDDRKLYIRLLVEQSRRFGVSYLAYCLMRNHVHLIAIPKTESSLALAMAETHRQYTQHVNLREGWTGYLWQGRFASYPMDDRHLYSAMRYVELNPVRAGIVTRPEHYPWSSAKAHVLGTKDPVIEKGPMERRIGDWKDYLGAGENENDKWNFERHIGTGRPFGDAPFIRRLEALTGRVLAKRKVGLKKPKRDR